MKGPQAKVKTGGHIAIRYMEDVLVRGLGQEMGYSLVQRHAS